MEEGASNKPLFRRLLMDVNVYFKSVLILLVPVLALPLAVVNPTPPLLCLYVVVVVAVFWIFEVCPIAITALLPLVLFPILGIVSAADLYKVFLSDASFIVLGGFFSACAIERWNLHKRIALKVLSYLPGSPVWLLLGFMGTTAFLSMWLSNTASTAMMIPIVQAVLKVLKATNSEASALNSDKVDKDNTSVEMVAKLPAQDNDHEKGNSVEDERTISDNVDFEQSKRVTVETEPVLGIDKAFMLCICQSASIGGTGTLIGSPTNLILTGILGTMYGPDTGVDFGSFFLFGFPTMVICLVSAWVWLQILYFGLGAKDLVSCFRCQCDPVKQRRYAMVKTMILRQYSELGPMSFAEKSVAIHFFLMAVLWITRDPKFVPGWASLFGAHGSYIKDGTVAMAIGFSYFCFPSEKPRLHTFGAKEAKSSPALLDWYTVQHHLSWDMILLLGGGFALATGVMKSGLSDQLAEQFQAFQVLPTAIMVAIIVTIVTFTTEITSNTSTATIILPILAKMAEGIGINPLYLMMPAALACSCAFMLPVATPPNAIVFSVGTLRVIDMMKSGLVLNIVCITVILGTTMTLGNAIFDLNTFPTWIT